VSAPPSWLAWERAYARASFGVRPGAGARWLSPHLARLHPDARVLDLGCGNRPATREAGADAILLDASAAALAAAVGPRRLRADACALPFRDACVQAIVARHVFGHLREDERKAASGECRRVLSSDGRMLVEAFARGDLRDPGTGVAVRQELRTGYASATEVASWFPGFSPVELREESVETRYGARRRVVGAFAPT